MNEGNVFTQNGEIQSPYFPPVISFLSLGPRMTSQVQDNKITQVGTGPILA